MSKKTMTEEEIMKRWGASLEQQYLSPGTLGNPLIYCESGIAHHDYSEQPWRCGPSPVISQNGSSFSMPTDNVSDMDGDVEARSSATVSGSFEEEHPYCVDGKLVALGIPVPDEVHLDESAREKIHQECELAAMGCSLSDKLTSDDISSDPEVLPPSKLSRPVAITNSDRCVTPQINNLLRNSKFPVSPGVKSKSSEVFHYTYETDLHTPSNPVPAFVVVPDSGVASRVTITPKGTAIQSTVLHVRRKRNRSLSRNACLFLLVSVLILSLVTLAAGIVKARFDTKQIPTPETSSPTMAWPTHVHVLVTPAPSPSTTTPIMQPFFSVPNDDVNINFPDLDGGIVAREETASPTASDYVPPTPAPRTRRPTTAPTPSLAFMDDDLITNTSANNETEHDTDTSAMRTYIQRLIMSAYPLANLTMVDPSSHQSQALEWIVSDQLSTDQILPDSRILQRFTLATLFFSTSSGGNWTNSTRWLTSSNECDWYHPRTNNVCDASGMIHTLQLDGNGLSGTLPSELAIMSLLRGIFVRNNRIHGTIPTQLATLEMLEYLQLTNNALEGTLPTELGNLANLTVLGVGRNFFNGTLPSELGLLNSLVTMGIEGNNIEGTIPTELASIDTLRFLSLRVNNLSGSIPSELGSLSQLAVFEVDANSLSGSVPLEICSLRATTLTSVLVDCDRIVCTSLCCDNC